MPMIGIQGIRGGVGTTSLAAGLGWALSQLGERVMLVDACRDNQLCLHFNQKLYEQQGSMFAYLQQQVWYEAAFHFSEGLDFYLMETLLLIRKQLRITYRFFSAKKISSHYCVCMTG